MFKCHLKVEMFKAVTALKLSGDRTHTHTQTDTAFYSLGYFKDFALEGQQAAHCWELNNLMREDGKDLSKAANIPKASKNSLVNNAADFASDENWWLLYLICLISSTSYTLLLHSPIFIKDITTQLHNDLFQFTPRFICWKYTRTNQFRILADSLQL